MEQRVITNKKHKIESNLEADGLAKAHSTNFRFGYSLKVVQAESENVMAQLEQQAIQASIC